MMLFRLSVAMLLAHGVQTLPPSSSGSTVSLPATVNSLTESKVLPGETCGGSNLNTCPEFECCSPYDYSETTSSSCSLSYQLGLDSCTDSPALSSTNLPNTPTRRSTSLQDCLGARNVPVSFPNSSNFAALAQPYNLRLAFTPAVIVLPATVTHISDAITCAAENKVKIQAKSGGHSYASFSSGGQDGSMVIDLEPGFQGIAVYANGNARVEAGVRVGNMALAIFDQGGRALPHGICPGVGIGGHASHGGFGYSSRAWGLTLDTIIALEVVLANGTFINATSTAYPDIFYALRGAADSIGIITAFYLATQPAPVSVVNWQYNLPGMFTSAAASAAVFQSLQEFALDASVVDRNLGMGMYMDGQGIFFISGTYFGSLATFTAKIAPRLLAGIPTPSSSSVTSNSWIDSLTKLASPNPLQQPTTTPEYQLHDNFFAKSVTTPQSSPLTLDAMTAYFSYIIQHGVNAPPNPWFSIINLYGGPDSQINNVPSASSSSAYSDRSALWVAQHYGFTTSTTTSTRDPGSSFPPPVSMDFIDGLNAALTRQMPGVEFGAYLNYVDPTLSPAEAHALYYDAETYAKLLEIKRRVDPGDVFWNPQSVGT